jgi:hypothetical protein
MIKLKKSFSRKLTKSEEFRQKVLKALETNIVKAQPFGERTEKVKR